MRDWITVVKVAKYREPQTPPKAVSTANQIKPDTGNNPENKNVYSVVNSLLDALDADKVADYGTAGRTGWIPLVRRWSCIIFIERNR